MIPETLILVDPMTHELVNQVVVESPRVPTKPDQSVVSSFTSQPIQNAPVGLDFLLGLIAQNESQLSFGGHSFKQLIPPPCGCRCRTTHPTFKIAAEIDFLRETPTMGVLGHHCSCEEEECSEDRCPCP